MNVQIDKQKWELPSLNIPQYSLLDLNDWEVQDQILLIKKYKDHMELLPIHLSNFAEIYENMRNSEASSKSEIIDLKSQKDNIQKELELLKKPVSKSVEQVLSNIHHAVYQITINPSRDRSLAGDYEEAMSNAELTLRLLENQMENTKSLLSQNCDKLKTTQQILSDKDSKINSLVSEASRLQEELATSKKQIEESINSSLTKIIDGPNQTFENPLSIKYQDCRTNSNFSNENYDCFQAKTANFFVEDSLNQKNCYEYSDDSNSISKGNFDNNQGNLTKSSFFGQEPSQLNQTCSIKEEAPKQDAQEKQVLFNSNDTSFNSKPENFQHSNLFVPYSCHDQQQANFTKSIEKENIDLTRRYSSEMTEKIIGYVVNSEDQALGFYDGHTNKGQQIQIIKSKNQEISILKEEILQLKKEIDCNMDALKTQNENTKQLEKLENDIEIYKKQYQNHMEDYNKQIIVKSKNENLKSSNKNLVEKNYKFQTQIQNLTRQKKLEESKISESDELKIELDELKKKLKFYKSLAVEYKEIAEQFNKNKKRNKSYDVRKNKSVVETIWPIEEMSEESIDNTPIISLSGLHNIKLSTVDTIKEEFYDNSKSPAMFEKDHIDNQNQKIFELKLNCTKDKQQIQELKGQLIKYLATISELTDITKDYETQASTSKEYTNYKALKELEIKQLRDFINKLKEKIKSHKDEFTQKFEYQNKAIQARNTIISEQEQFKEDMTTKLVTEIKQNEKYKEELDQLQEELQKDLTLKKVKPKCFDSANVESFIRNDISSLDKANVELIDNIKNQVEQKEEYQNKCKEQTERSDFLEIELGLSEKKVIELQEKNELNNEIIESLKEKYSNDIQQIHKDLEQKKTNKYKNP